MDFWPAVLATITGSILLGLMAMACAYVGAATGLSTAMISRVVFGRVGGAVLAGALTLSLLGWFAVQAGFFGSNAQIAFFELTGADIPVALFTAAGGLLMLLTALWGYRSISKLSEFAVPALLLLLLAGVVMGFATQGAAGLTEPVVTTFTFGGAVSLVMGIFILGVVTAPDMARWARTPKHAMIAGFVGFFFGNSIIVIVAIVLARLMNQTEIVTMYFILGLGVVAIVVLILAQWTTNSSNIYSAALSFAAINKRFSRRVVTIVGGVIGILIAVLGASDVFIPFISAIGIIIAPYGGVYLAAFFFERNTGKFVIQSNERNIRPLAAIAWVAGILAAVASTHPADGLGFGLVDFTTIPALDGLIVGFIVYLVVAQLRGRDTAQPESEPSAATSPVEQDA
jgi:cytosine permease